MKKRKWKNILLATITAVLFLTVMTACSEQGNGTGSMAGSGSEYTGEGSVNMEMSTSDKDALMDQVAESEAARMYADYLPDEVFADAEIFGIDRNGHDCTAYAYLYTAEYVALKGKAYDMSGSAGEVILRYTETESGPDLSEVEWSADGSDHDRWLEEHFPEEYLEKQRNYEAFDADGKNRLATGIKKEVAEVLGVPVETENMLQIDTEQGTYEIIKTTESGTGDDYRFESETIEKGMLSDLTD